ncbi:MAG: zinc ABC transporter substrate-binding protein [Rhodobacteraceae bacterium]|nr:zinc ABC transporter substrate-binding protein [Paracoccaceae bacterium]
MRKFLLSGLLLAGPAMADAPRVAVDIAPVHALVAQVMQGVGAPDLVIPPGASPHDHRLRPSEARALDRADIVVWVGGSLTPWLDGAIDTLGRDATVVELIALDGTRVLDFRDTVRFDKPHGDHDHAVHDGHDHAAHDGHDHAAHDDHDHAAHDDHDHAAHGDHDHAAHDDHDHAAHDDHDHAAHDDHDHAAHDDHDHAAHDDHGHDDHGHDHSGHDPHVWLDPQNAAYWLGHLAEVLAAADPDHADQYRRNAEDGQAALAELIARTQARLAPVRDTGYVVFHDAYQYFETRFAIPAAGAITLGDASDPSAARIAEIRRVVADAGARCVFSEPQFNSGLVRTVFQGSTARTAILDPMGSTLTPGPALYAQLIDAMANTMAECLAP